MSRQKKQHKPNGHAGPNGPVNGKGDHEPVNGHGQPPAGRGGVPVHGNQAASDDASGASGANTTASSAEVGTGREACAAAAPPQSQGSHGISRNGNGKSGKGKAEEPDAFHLLGSTEVSAIQDGAAYFDAVAARVDLVGASVRLIITKDQKISKSELDRLREMKFGKTGTSVVEDLPRADFGDLPRPER